MRKLELVSKNTLETKVAELILINDDSTEMTYVSAFTDEDTVTYLVSRKSLVDCFMGISDISESDIIEGYYSDDYQESAYAEYIDIVKKAYWMI